MLDDGRVENISLIKKLPLGFSCAFLPVKLLLFFLHERIGKSKAIQCKVVLGSAMFMRVRLSIVVKDY